MSAGRYDLMIYQGADFNLPIELQDGAEVAIDLTGATATAQIRETASSPTIVESFTCTIASPGTLGKLSMNLSAAQTAAIPVKRSTEAAVKPTEYAYDLEILLATGKKWRFLYGIAYVSPEVTRV